jgi:hypothetical protein
MKKTPQKIKLKNKSCTFVNFFLRMKKYVYNVTLHVTTQTLITKEPYNGKHKKNASILLHGLNNNLDIIMKSL